MSYFSFSRQSYVCRLAVALMAAVIITTTPSCRGTGGGRNDSDTVGNNLMRHSRLLRLYDVSDSVSVAEIVNPWDTTKLTGRYILKPRSVRFDCGQGDIIVPVPVVNVVAYSSVHAGALEELGAIDAVKGVVDSRYFKIAAIRDGLADGAVEDMGAASSPSVERLVAMKPDAILLSLYEGMDVTGIDRLGLTLVQLVDNMEQTPLGRAEWIRLLGRLVGKGAHADSLFHKIEKEYNELKEEGIQLRNKPRVMTDNIYQGIWYVPGGASYQARMIADAGGEYVFADDRSAGSLNLSYEEVLGKARDADIWILRVFGKDVTRDMLLAEDPRYRHFNPFKSGEIYYSDTESSRLYEDFPFHPERLLKDYILMFRRLTGIQSDSLVYFRRMSSEN